MSLEDTLPTYRDFQKEVKRSVWRFNCLFLQALMEIKIHIILEKVFDFGGQSKAWTWYPVLIIVMSLIWLIFCFHSLNFTFCTYSASCIIFTCLIFFIIWLSLVPTSFLCIITSYSLLNHLSSCILCLHSSINLVNPRVIFPVSYLHAFSHVCSL